MNQTINYQKKLDQLIDGFQKENRVPTLLLHSCCGPCSSYCLEYLSQYFNITIFFYNPNISPASEYERRANEQQRLIEELDALHPIKFRLGNYDADRFYAMAKGLEKEPEGGKRCFGCYELRLREAAIACKELGIDYFTTTLSISPHKNAVKLNEIGEAVGKEYGVTYLPSDFKKKNGYKRSVELSKEHHLYRQDYCGCVYSKLEAEQRIKEQEITKGVKE